MKLSLDLSEFENIYHTHIAEIFEDVHGIKDVEAWKFWRMFYKKVAKKLLKSNENIVFGKFDGTGNDIPYMFPPLKGYPSLFFVSAYEKYDPIMYQGDRSYKSVKDWINR